MGLVPELRSKGYMVKALKVVNEHGERVAGFPVDAFVRITHGRYVSIARADLSSAIFSKIEGKAETIFADSISGIEQTDRGVHVSFESGAGRDFDLVIGADGLHSRVRELVFGAEDRFEKFLGYKVAAFEAEGYRPRDELIYVMYTEVGQQVGRFTMRDDRTLFLFTFSDQDPDGTSSGGIEAQKAVLRKRFGDSGWECPQIMEALSSTNDLYFDRVSQIQMGKEAGSWTRGRISLAGDAAFCVSLLAGQGSALAMVAAYILAGELHRAGSDYASAFARYQEKFGPFVLTKQKAALRFAGTFAPKSSFSLFLRNQIMNLLTVPWIADFTVGRDLRDKLALPAY